MDWSIDIDQIELAKQSLGLRWPVKVTRTSCKGKLGSHRVRGFCHYITTDKYLNGLEASETLWHELGHAKQAEDVYNALPAGSTVYEFYKSYRLKHQVEHGIPYSVRPSEIDARSYESRALEHRLVISISDAVDSVLSKLDQLA